MEMECNTKKIKGFTLVELIVVIAIIGVLAGILVPSLIGYVKKAQRKADAANAKVIHDDIMAVLYTDESLYDGFISNGVPGKQTPLQSFSNIPNGSNFTTSVSVNNGTSVENYEVYVACYMDSYIVHNDGSLDWLQGNVEGTAFVKALQKFQEVKSKKSEKKSTIPLSSKSCNGYKTTRWYVCYRKKTDPKAKQTIDQIEIWVGDSTDTDHWRTHPYFRLYPDCCTEYR